MTKIEITVNDKASDVVKRLQPAALLPVIAGAIDKQNQLTIDRISRKYVSYPKQGPTTLEGLRTISGDYRRAMHSFPAQVIGSEIVSAIGVQIKTKSGFNYAALHEFGGVVQRPARSGSVRLRTDAKGNLVRQSKFRQIADGNGNSVIPSKLSRLAVFARKSHVRAKTVEYTAKAHEAVYPARRPIQRGIEDRLPEYKKALSAAIIRFAEAGS